MANSFEEVFKRVLSGETAAKLHEQAIDIQRLRSADNPTERLRYRLQRNAEMWTGPAPPRDTEVDAFIEDPVYQQVSIQAQIKPIYLHPLVQRLSHVKQLSFSYLTFPTATHSRLSHSLGVCRNAELALRTIFQQGWLYGRKERAISIDLGDEDKKSLFLTAKVAALLHDIGHGPFGHGLDQYLSPKIKDTSPDKFFGSQIIKDHLSKTLRDCKIDPETILKILGKEKSDLTGYENLVSEIIDSPLDVDRMDYLVRDALLTGLSLGTVNIQALIARMVPFVETQENVTKVILVFLPSAIPYITHLLYARDAMYVNCYEHSTKVIAEKMLMRAVTDLFSRTPAPDLTELILLTDEELLRMLLQESEPHELSYKYAYALMQNNIFKEVYSCYPKRQSKLIESVETWKSTRGNYRAKFESRPREWEQELADAVGLAEDEHWKILVTVPSDGMYLRKDSEIRILERDDNGKYTYLTWAQLSGYWEEVFEALGAERYCFRVFASNDLGDKLTAVEKAAKDFFMREPPPLKQENDH